MQFPKRAHIPQPLNGSDNFVDDEVNLLLGREATDTESERRVRHVFRGTERSKNVGWLERGRGAGGSRREGNVLVEEQASGAGRHNVVRFRSARTDHTKEEEKKKTEEKRGDRRTLRAMRSDSPSTKANERLTQPG